MIYKFQMNDNRKNDEKYSPKKSNMKYLTLILLIFIGINNLYAQILEREYTPDMPKMPLSVPDSPKNPSKSLVSVHDTIFKDAIAIQEKDVITDGNIFLIKFPIKIQKEPIVIWNLDRRIPSQVFFERKSFLYGQNEILLITPDWKAIEDKDNPLPKINLYHISRNNTGFSVDSLNVSQNESKKIKIYSHSPYWNEKEVKFILTEGYGSSCCPRDNGWDFYTAVQEQIKLFEEQNKVVISKTGQSLGEEGEHVVFYQLDNLSDEQKLMFIRTIRTARNEQFSKIFTAESNEK